MFIDFDSTPKSEKKHIFIDFDSTPQGKKNIFP